MMYLAISPDKNDVEILECNHRNNIHVYPNGIIQINFEDVDLQPKGSIDFVLRIKTRQPDIPKEHIIKNNYLFFCF